MTAAILPFPSRCLAAKRRQRRNQGPPPARDIMKIVRLDHAIGDHKDALEDRGARDNRVLSAFDLAYVGLTALKLVRKPLLRLPLLPPPVGQLHNNAPDLGQHRYCDSLYFVNGHKQVEGAEYKQMAYVFAMHPGNRIRELRKQKGLSQIELAQRTGVSQPAISQFENDGLTLDIDRMRVFARIFECSTADILNDGDNPDRLTSEERELLAQFRAADDAQREMIRRVAQPLRQGRGDEREAA